ncbi:multidrug ABC transporter permease [Bacillus sp. FJAT-27231]|uniref:ABC transporter permease subunit n=1 Tax=Bacillus sp. FJAT-27231 TaxID=1679168 RepID=UPI0006716582|nr:ABC transporter permease subunit [Bacillus sp. FJAT-27231]KMY55368.1 multidrug ABC transporter permease [Bacillus sp. FJAT-27231]
MIFQREWKRGSKSLIIWSLILAGLIIWLLSIFPQFAKQQEGLEKLFQAYPDSMKEMFKMNELNLGTLMGFYGLEVYMMITLLGSIYAAIFASNILAKEENEKTVEFLLSKPVTRSEVVGQKIAIVILNVLILNGVAAIASIAGFQFAEGHKVPYGTFMSLVAGAVLLHLTFAALSFLLSACMKKTRNTLVVSIGIVVVAYLLNMMSGLSESLDALKYVSPFYYADAVTIIQHHQLAPWHITVMAAVILLSLLGAFIVYKKKDLSA